MRLVPPALRRLIRRDAVVVAQHKPRSFLSPSDSPQGDQRFAVDLLTEHNYRGAAWSRADDPRDVPGLECAGRLDAESTGLLLWTDEPALVQHIIGRGSPVSKEYLVRLTGHEQWSDVQRDESTELLREGITLDGAPLRPARVDWLNEDQLKVTLTEGKHRQIRRMCGIVGLHVTAIKRVRIGELRLASLPVGCWTALTPANAASLLLARRVEPRRPTTAQAAAPRPRRKQAGPSIRAEAEAFGAHAAEAPPEGLLFGDLLRGSGARDRRRGVRSGPRESAGVSSERG